MASTFSPTLRLELIGDGDQSGIWGQTTNNNLGTLLEQAITGVTAVTMTDANYTLTNYNGVTDEARNAVLVVSGTNSAVRDLIAPLAEKLYTVKNSTTGGYGIRIIGSSGTGVTIANGTTALVYCDGTNFYDGLTGIPGNLTVTGNESVGGNLSVTGNVTVTGNASANNATITNTITAATHATTNWTITETGGKLYFAYSGVNKGSLDSSGNFIVTGNVTAYGTP